MIRLSGRRRRPPRRLRAAPAVRRCPWGGWASAAALSRPATHVRFARDQAREHRAGGVPPVSWTP